MTKYMKNGCFTMKVAYHLKMKLTHNASEVTGASSSCTSDKGWLALWGVDLLQKSKSISGDL